MPSPKPPPNELIALAAELRAGGSSWEAVAAKVGRAADTVRRWPAAYPAAWKTAFRAAELRLLAEATAESVHTLRRLLRSDDEKVSRDAARSLIQYRVTSGKRAGRSGKSKSKSPTTDAARAAAYLEGMTDAQIDDLIRELLPAVAASVGQPLPPEPGQ
jgi:hypothetical protein